MKSKIPKRTKNLAQVIKSLGHPTRLFIIEELAEKERCVFDLTKMTGFDMSTVSRHLSILKSAGIVEIDKRGLQIFYRLKTPCILKFLSCIDNVIKSKIKEYEH